jgi:asparagine synthetase B (glutamine-hydrolysing)
VLFSGGVDCSLIAHLIAKLTPNGTVIDLINVSFAKDSPDRLTALSSYGELQKLHGNKTFNLILVDKSMDDVLLCESDFLKVIYPKVKVSAYN